SAVGISFPRQGVRVSRKFVLPFLLAAVASCAQAADAKPVDCTQLSAWLMAGVSTNRVARIAQDRGYSFVAIDSTVKTLRAAGADAGLIAVLQKGKPVEIASDTSCSPQLGPIAGLIQQKSYQQRSEEHTSELQSRGHLV